MADFIDVVERKLLTIQALHFCQQVLQLTHLPLPGLCGVPRVPHPEESVNIGAYITLCIIHVILRVPLIVQGPDFTQEIFKLVYLLLLLFCSMRRVPHPKQAVRIGANLALLIIHMILWVLVIVQTLDLLEQVFQFLHLCSPSLWALARVLHPRETINICTDVKFQIVHMVLWILLVVQVLDLRKQALEHTHLVVLHALTCELLP
mmetsp:Transcript_26632/g.70672  ORF Transcript_26632/g.70672 Transcript_26632/m.70672 type:complete len:205 (-) Transcript_26632:1536-2150(-)